MTKKKDPKDFKRAIPTVRYGPETKTCGVCSTVMKREDFSGTDWVVKKYCSKTCAYKAIGKTWGGPRSAVACDEHRTGRLYRD
jgi:hypothetical protein